MDGDPGPSRARTALAFASVVAAPLGFRIAAIADRGGGVALSDLRGVLADASTTLLVLAAVVAVSRIARVAAVALVALWTLLQYANFETVRVNASNQRNIVWLNRLMHHKWFADLVVRLVPKRLILHARYWVQTRRASGPEATHALGAQDDRAFAEERLQGDRQYVEELFQESGLLLGTGEATSPDALRQASPS